MWSAGIAPGQAFDAGIDISIFQKKKMKNYFRFIFFSAIHYSVRNFFTSITADAQRG